MFSRDPKRNLFDFIFPETFFVKEICEKYNQYLRQREYPLETIEDVLMESLQGFTTPEYGVTLIEQTKRDNVFLGTQKYEYPKESVQKMSEKSFQITFRHVEGFITYNFIQELLFHFYRIGEKDSNLRGEFGNCILKLNRHDGDYISKNTYNQCYILGLGSLDLTYSSITRDFVTFTVNFGYNDLSSSFNIPDLDLKK